MLEAKSITVRFGAVTALKEISLTLAPGSRVAVVGENGAGKSTLMKVLFGLLQPDSGIIQLNGADYRFRSPKDAISAGIGMVQQHFDLIGPFTVAENIVLGSEPKNKLRFDRKRAEAEVALLAEKSHLAIDPAARIETLSVAAQQRVEILKALYRNAKILILDEPTATLAPSEARDLWAAVHRLSSIGTTVVFVTHQLTDVMAHAEIVTVLRRGQQVLTTPVSQTTPQQLASAMIGESAMPDRLVVMPQRQEKQKSAVLSLTNLSVRGPRGNLALENLSLTLNRGEILGIAGVDGSGQTELIEAVVGLRQISGGEIVLNDNDITRLSVKQRRALKLAYIPEDRHRHAIAQTLTITENAILGQQCAPQFVSKFGLLRQKSRQEFTQQQVTAFDVRGADSIDALFGSLSGGNQQKLVLARELSQNPSVLIAAQPTRGLDFAATAFVHQKLRAAADADAAILVTSLDLAEILKLSDRVAVLLQGRLVGILDRQKATEETIGALMTGASQ
jgi:general nucleoside transport system ATP-binding protein